VTLLLFIAASTAQTYYLKTVVLDAGGKSINGTNYKMNLSFGQPMASNIVSSTNLRCVLGFYRVFNCSTQTGAYPGIEDKEFQNISILPLNYALSQCFPNPFHNQAVIKYSLPVETDVCLKIYNNSGQIVGTLVNQKQGPGQYNITWNINNVSKSKLPNGVYFYQLQTDKYTSTKKMVILR